MECQIVKGYKIRLFSPSQFIFNKYVSNSEHPENTWLESETSTMKSLTNNPCKHTPLATGSVIWGFFHILLVRGTSALQLPTSGHCLCSHTLHAWSLPGSASSAQMWDSIICTDSAPVGGTLQDVTLTHSGMRVDNTCCSYFKSM